MRREPSRACGKVQEPHPQANLESSPSGEKGVHELPYPWHLLPCGPKPTLPSSWQPHTKPFCIKYK